MKKLMIALAAVAVAAGVQASSIDWSIGSKSNCDPANSSKFIGNETANLLSFSSATVADTLYTALAAGEMTVAQAISTYGIGAPATSTAAAGKTEGSIGTQKINGLSNAAGSTGYFAVIVASGDKFILSDTIEKQYYLTGDAQYGDETEAKFISGQFSKTADVRTGWTTPAAVPEPTSAMLLLLGMAGLALRRRRA